MSLAYQYPVILTQSPRNRMSRVSLPVILTHPAKDLHAPEFRAVIKRTRHQSPSGVIPSGAPLTRIRNQSAGIA